MIDRLDDVTIGEPCKVDGCSTVCVEGEDRCHDHSVNRMIEGLFAPGENCRFGGIDCTIQATHSNPHDVPMCETCYNVWVRIQRGNAVNQLYRSPYSAEVRYVRGDQQSMGQIRPPYMTGETPSGYDGGSYHRNINWRAWMERAQEEEVQPMRRDEGEETE